MQSAARVFHAMMTTDDDGHTYIGATFLLPALQMVGLNPTFSDVTEMLMLSDIGDGKVRQSDFETFVLQLTHTRFSRKLIESCFDKVLSGTSSNKVLHVDEFAHNFQSNEEGLTTEEVSFIRLHNANGRDEVEIQRFTDFLAGEKPVQVVARPEKPIRQQVPLELPTRTAYTEAPKPRVIVRESIDVQERSASVEPSIVASESETLDEEEYEESSCTEEVEYVRCCC